MNPLRHHTSLLQAFRPAVAALAVAVFTGSSGHAPAQLVLANPNWNITLTDSGYSDFLLDNTPGFEGREYLSGEWGAAVGYTAGGPPVTPQWLEPHFSYPGWTTNSTFTVVTPIHLTGALNADGHPKCIIRWESKKNPDGTWAAHTAIPAGPIAPTNGHMFTDPSVNFGGEHFGAGYTVQPTAIRYNWHIDNGSGTLVHGGAVQVSTPTFTYYPPVVVGVPAPPAVQAVIAPPPPPAPEPKEFGKAIWIKEIRTSSHNHNEVKLRDLLSENPNDPNGKNWRNGEPNEVETEWQILQKDYGKADAPNNEKAAAAEDLPNADEVVTRRYEFYKYEGPLDDETGEAMGDSVGPDGIHGVGTKLINGVEVDLTTVAVVGAFTGSQMAAVDVDAPVGLIDHVSDGELGTAYAARTVVVEGSLPFSCLREGALPTGMVFDEFSGQLSGTSEESGEFNFTITITATDGFHLVNWTDSGKVVSTAASYTFVIDVNHTLVANFAINVPQ